MRVKGSYVVIRYIVLVVNIHGWGLRDYMLYDGVHRVGVKGSDVVIRVS